MNSTFNLRKLIAYLFKALVSNGIASDMVNHQREGEMLLKTFRDNRVSGGIISMGQDEKEESSNL